MSSCSGLMASTSKAVGRPRLQHGMKMLPGRACEPGSKPGVSLDRTEHAHAISSGLFLEYQT